MCDLLSLCHFVKLNHTQFQTLLKQVKDYLTQIEIQKPKFYLKDLLEYNKKSLDKKWAL